MTAPTIRCPQCGKAAEYSPENAFRPFCSKRCKLIDLGAWAEERYSIAGKPSTADLHEAEISNDESDRPSLSTRLDS